MVHSLQTVFPGSIGYWNTVSVMAFQFSVAFLGDDNSSGQASPVSPAGTLKEYGPG